MKKLKIKDPLLFVRTIFFVVYIPIVWVVFRYTKDPINLLLYLPASYYFFYFVVSKLLVKKFFSENKIEDSNLESVSFDDSAYDDDLFRQAEELYGKEYVQRQLTYFTKSQFLELLKKELRSHKNYVGEDCNCDCLQV